MKLLARLGVAATLFVMSVASVSLSSCEAITEAATVGVPITIELFPESINPVVPTEDEDCANMAEYKDYQDNKDMIESGSLKEATFEILDLQNPDFNVSAAVFSFVRFELTFDDQYGDSKVYNLGSFTNVVLQTLLDGPVEVALSNDAQQAIDLIVGGREKFCVKAVYGAFNPPINAASASYLRGKIALTIDFKAQVI